jgi:hypothetical protein
MLVVEVTEAYIAVRRPGTGVERVKPSAWAKFSSRYTHHPGGLDEYLATRAT